MKKIEDMRVVDLRSELDKRGLDKNGVKAVLIERIRKAIEEEGGDPDNFEPDTSLKSSTMKSEEVEISPATEDAESETKLQDPLETETELPSVSEEKVEETEVEVEPNSDEPNKEESIISEVVDETPIQEVTQDEQDPLDTNTTDEVQQPTLSEAESVHNNDLDEALDQEDFENSLNMQEDGIDLLLEDDEDKILDYEESDRIDMEDASADDQGNKTKVASKQSEDQAPRSTNGEKEGDESSKKEATTNGTDADKEKASAKAPTWNMWVSGLRSNAKAQDLRGVFLKYGKVLSVKIVTSSNSNSGRCFGLVSMASKEAADACIKNLNKTEVNGRMIHVEMTSRDSKGALKPGDRKSSSSDVRTKKEDSVDRKRSSDHGRPGRGRGSHGDRRDSRDQNRSRDSKGPSDEKPSVRDRIVDRRNDARGSASRPVRPRRDVLNLRKIEDERVRQRMRTKERLMREEERRRRDEAMQRRNFERRQREEAMVIQREREKLRLEREKLEREKLELIRIEKEQQRIERERIQREREEIRRQQIKYEEVRRGIKRPNEDRERPREFYDERKRPAADRPRFPPPVHSAPSRDARFHRPGPPAREPDLRQNPSSHGAHSNHGGHGSHYEERRERDDRRRGGMSDRGPSRDDHRDMRDAARERSSRSDRYSNNISSSSGNMDWRPAASHGHVKNVSFNRDDPVMSGPAPTSWRPYNGSSSDRWSGNTSSQREAPNVGLLDIMRSQSSSHLGGHQSLPLLQGMGQNDRYSSVPNYRKM